MDSDWDSAKFASGTLDCILCKETILYSSGNKSELFQHLKESHRVKYHHSLLLAVTFLDNDSLGSIIEQFNKHEKSIQNKTPNDNVAASIARKKMNQAKRLLERNALINEEFMAKRIKRNLDVNNDKIVDMDKSAGENSDNFKDRAKQLAIKCNLELKSGGLFPTVKNMDTKMSGDKHKKNEIFDHDNENKYSIPPKVIKVMQQTGSYEKEQPTKTRQSISGSQVSTMFGLDDSYSNSNSSSSFDSKNSSSSSIKPGLEGNFTSKLDMGRFKNTYDRLKDPKQPPNDLKLTSQKQTGVIQKTYNSLIGPNYEETQSEPSLTIDDIFSNPVSAPTHSSRLNLDSPASTPLPVVDVSGWKLFPLEFPVQFDESQLKLSPSLQFDESQLKLSSSLQLDTPSAVLTSSSYSPSQVDSSSAKETASPVVSLQDTPTPHNTRTSPQNKESHEDDTIPEKDSNEPDVLDPLAITGENDFIPVFTPNQPPTVFKSKSVIKTNSSSSNSINKATENSSIKVSPESEESFTSVVNKTDVETDTKEEAAETIEDTSKETETVKDIFNETPEPPLDEANLKLSSDMADACRTYCQLCDDGTSKTLTQMRSHTKARHNVNISEYKAKFGNEYEIIEKVYHKCAICGMIVLLDSDFIASHLKSKEHKAKDPSGTSHKGYNEKFMAAKKANSALSVLGF